MGFIGSLKRKCAVPAGLFPLIFMFGGIAFLPSCGKQDAGPEVISKRVKLDLPDTPGEQQPKTDQKPTVGSMPDVKADLPVKEVVKPEATKPAIKVEIPEKKESEKDNKAARDLKVKEKDTANPAVASSVAPEKKPGTSETTEKPHVNSIKKAVYTKSALRKAKLRPWAVNVASFPTEAEAKKLISSLKSSGYNGYTTEFKKNAMKWHRVRVGFYRTKNDALKAGKKIEAKFHVGSSWAVQPAKEETIEHIK